jgi:threonine dehydratase
VVEPTIDDVRSAAARLRGVAVRTPVLHSDAMPGVAFKAECLQRGGSFKLRGAYTKISSLSDVSRGVAAVSSGNHAIGVALSASLLDTSAVILTPLDAPAVKIDRARALGAEIVTFDRYTEDRDAVTAAFAAARGLPFVPPFDDPVIMSGQGTVALELLEDEPGIDTLVVPMSGGGLMAGCAVVASSLRPDLRLVGVEPAAMDDTRRSFAAGERVSVPAAHTIADGLTVTQPGERTWEINRRAVAEVVAVTDDEIVEAMRWAFEHLHVVVEPSGAVGIAALRTGRVVPGARTGVVLSGGNIAIDTFTELIGGARG